MWRELLTGLREHERLHRRLRPVVQPQVHRHVDVHDDGGRERERRLLRGRDLPHHVRRQLLDQLLGRIDLYVDLPRCSRNVDRRERKLFLTREGEER
jgi:hypothetical protein